MIRAREIRIALTGALVFMVAGMLQACASDAIAGIGDEPVSQPAAAQSVTAEAEGDGDADGDCIFSGGIRICR